MLATNHELMNRSYAYELARDPEGGGYVAHHPDLEGCLAQGESANEAIERLDEARCAWFQARLDDGLPIPRPADDEPSGRFSLRIPRVTHGDAVRRAARQGISLNLLISTALAEFLGAGSATERIEARMEALEEAVTNRIGARLETQVARLMAGMVATPADVSAPARWASSLAVQHAAYRLIVRCDGPDDRRMAEALLDTLPAPEMSIFFRGLAYLQIDPKHGYDLCLRAWRLGLTPDQASLVLTAIPDPIDLDDWVRDALFQALTNDEDLERAKHAASMLEWVSWQRHLPESAAYYARVARDPDAAAA